MLRGRCHCGKVTFTIAAQAVHAAVCHCSDCRQQSGAPFLAWAMVPRGSVEVRGTPALYRSSEKGRRTFCGECGTGLFFTNALLEEMGMVQVRIAALANPEAVVPQIQVQTAEKVAWTDAVPDLPAFHRFPT